MPTMDGLMGANNALSRASSSSYSDSSSRAGGSSGTGGGGMSINDFYKVLATQLRYQDADNPMNTSEMMSQMVQTQMIEAITRMSEVNTITYAASLVGKEVTMKEVDANGMFTDEETTGVITGMVMGDPPLLFVGDKAYFMSQIMAIGTVPELPDEDGDKNPTDPPETGGEGGEGDEATKSV